MSWQHLDLECAKFAEATLERLVAESVAAKDALPIVLDAGSVLPKQGPYAMVLYLQQKGAKNNKAPLLILEGAIRVLKNLLPPNDGDARQVVKNISESLPNLLLARKLLIVYLSYLKYQLKVRAGDA